MKSLMTLLRLSVISAGVFIVPLSCVLLFSAVFQPDSVGQRAIDYLVSLSTAAPGSALIVWLTFRLTGQTSLDKTTTTIVSKSLDTWLHVFPPIAAGFVPLGLLAVSTTDGSPQLFWGLASAFTLMNAIAWNVPLLKLRKLENSTHG